MSRTPLFAAVKKALVLASRDNSVVGPRTSALTRRRRTLLRASAAAAGTAVPSPVSDWSAYAREQPKGPIAIVGGGVAGLTAAYRLHQAGGTPIVFEASNRWGGRMFTVYNFYKGMFCELGGELVDSNHDDLRELLHEFGLERQKLAGENEGQDLYFFNGVFRTLKEIVDPDKQSGAFAPIAKRIRTDANKLTDDHGHWTDYARKLDNKSLKHYLEQFRGKTEGWVIDLLDVAYVGECGLETEDLSSLNLVNFIGTDLSKSFQIFGESDEAWRIKGGSSKLIDALVETLKKNKIEMKLGYVLTELDKKNEQIVMSFDAPGGAQQATFDAVILALPFTCLRTVKLDGLHLSQEKLKCIRELGMGQNAKIMVGTASRVWRTSASDLPAPSNGSICSDLAFQDFWETSRAQQLGEAGILTNFLGGNAALTDAKSALDAFRAGLAKMSPKMAASVDPAAVTSFFWSNYRYTLGSYTAAKVGQYTTMLEEAGKPALDGRLQFAGEHTAKRFIGYMNGGVQSGNRAAKELIKVIALPG